MASFTAPLVPQVQTGPPFVREDGAKDRAKMASRTEGLCWWTWVRSLRLTSL